LHAAAQRTASLPSSAATASWRGGALVEALGFGLTVSGDLSIIGIDDLEFAAHLSPPLTTASVPAEDMGRLAARQVTSCPAQRVDVLHLDLLRDPAPV